LKAGKNDSSDINVSKCPSIYRTRKKEITRRNIPKKRPAYLLFSSDLDFIFQKEK
jgi:hypothetical protein